jgi:hypothetical protein
MRGAARGSASVILVIAAAWLLCLPALAEAAPSKFVSEQCDPQLPGGAPPSADFVGTPGGPFTPFQNCASPGGAIGITETGSASNDYAYWFVTVPATPGGYVESLVISAHVCGRGPANDHTLVYEQGWPTSCAADAQRLFYVHDTPTSSNGGAAFSILMNCDGNVGTCSAGPTIAARDLAATQVDPTPPTLTGPQGSLLAGGVLRGHQSLDVQAADVGGGVSRIELSVNGLPAAQPVVANCDLAEVKSLTYEGTVAASPTPCPAKLSADWTLDTAADPFRRGANTVEVCTSDYSSLTEANETCAPPQTVEVDNSCTESPIAGGEVISAQFTHNHKQALTVPHGRTARVAGELADDAGDAISGATVCVEMQTQGSRRGLVPVGTATTDAHGHFVYTVPKGPNRRVLVGYRHDSFQVARSVRYYAHAKPTIHISPGRVGHGGGIRIRGKLPGAQGKGRVVVLQASALHSRRWFTFRRATTNKHGVFHGRYRFGATTRTITYRIRAVAPRQRGYPWEVGHSKPALVKVKG